MSEKMDLRRHEQIGRPPAEEKVDFCLSQLEEHGFAKGVDWNTKVSHSVTMEELVGALVDAESTFIDPQYERRGREL